MDRVESENPKSALSVAALAIEATRAMAAFSERRAIPPEPAPADAREALLQRLAAEPWNMGFYQAVRRLENLYPDRPRIGHSRRLADDPVRFCQNPSLAFAPATMSAFRQRTDTAPPRLFIQFFGLCGPHGPLPLHITEYARECELHGAPPLPPKQERGGPDPTPARFFDLFNHRMIAFFYRAWAINQQTVSFERSVADSHLPDGGLQDRFASYFASLLGLGMSALRNRDACPDRAKLFYSGRYSNHAKNPEGLAAIVGDFLGVKAILNEFVGRWVDLPPEACCKIGTSLETCGLGSTAIVGSKIWDCQQEFQLRLGPMDFKQYQRLLPGSRTLRRLVAVVRNYIGDEFSWTIKLVLRADAVPKAKLGVVGQLGYSTWMSSKPIEADQENLELRPTAA